MRVNCSSGSAEEVLLGDVRVILVIVEVVVMVVIYGDDDDIT